ncbi:hypothetical protein PQR64_38350 [Paraburkholderia phytofirmans]|uniref:hypothetical protein n=1 Tax=Paraburkholderia phytofirmans TaxID=261302 RepID=UPI0038B80D68
MFHLDSEKTERLFNAYIDEFHVIDKDTMFSEWSGPSFTDFHREKSSVYFLAKTRRVTFIPETFVIESGFCLRGDVKVGSRVEAVRFNIAKILFEGSGVKKHFESWESWAAEVMSRWAFDNEPSLPADAKYRRGSSVDLDLSNNECLYIDCMLWQAVQEGDRSLRSIVTPVQLAHMFDWNVFDDIEILYVGKSTDNVLARTSNHNKWGAVTSSLKSDEMALVYFMKISHSPFAKIAPHPLLRLVAATPDDQLDRDAVSVITEAAIIKHFFKEKGFNQRIVNQPLEEVAKVKTKLVERGYTGVQVAVQLDGPLGVLGTDETGYHNHHVFRYVLRQL